MARTIPTMDEIVHLYTPLNTGEWEALDALQALDDEWTIHVQPRIGFSQPDFVVTHPRFGVCVIEVKDWNQGMYRTGRDGHVEVLRNGSWGTSEQHPRRQADRYRNDLYERFFAQHDGMRAPLDVVRGIVVVTGHTTTQARALLGCDMPGHPSSLDRVQVWGSRALRTGLVPVLSGTPHPYDKAVSAKGLDRLLRHVTVAEGVSDLRLPLRLCVAASNIERNWNKARIRRVRGAAGCGKSLGLAARAARLAGEGKSVLVVSYNSMLVSYLHDLAKRRCQEIRADIRQVTFAHFHGFCADVVQHSTHSGYSPVLTTEEQLGDQYEQLVQRAADAYRNGRVLPQFDAVLVDEGQDFTLEWWNFLRLHACKPEGEMLLVADPTQDVYGTRAWTDEDVMSGAGFSGPWAEMRGSYRLPPDLIPVVADFASRHLAGERVEPIIPFDHPLVTSAYKPTIRHWINAVGGESLGNRIGREVLRLLDEHADLAPGDIVFLAPSHAIGLQAVGVIEAGGQVVQHIFGANDGRRRGLKERFVANAPGVKGCTTQSFKGLESRAVVLSVESGDNSHRLAYVGLTRVKGDARHRSAFVSVVNSDRSLRDFRDTFEGSAASTLAG